MLQNVILGYLHERMIEEQKIYKIYISRLPSPYLSFWPNWVIGITEIPDMSKWRPCAPNIFWDGALENRESILVKYYKAKSLDGSPGKSLKLRNAPLTWEPRLIVDYAKQNFTELQLWIGQQPVVLWFSSPN